MQIALSSGVDLRREGEGGLTPSQGFEPLPTQRVSLCTIFQYPFLVMDPLAPIYTNFEGERAPKQRAFLVKVFQKVSKNAFFGLFFQYFASCAENLARIGTKQCSGRARKIILVDLKKVRPPSSRKS